RPHPELPARRFANVLQLHLVVIADNGPISPRYLGRGPRQRCETCKNQPHEHHHPRHPRPILPEPPHPPPQRRPRRFHPPPPPPRSPPRAIRSASKVPSCGHSNSKSLRVFAPSWFIQWSPPATPCAIIPIMPPSLIWSPVSSPSFSRSRSTITRWQLRATS